MSWVLTVDVDGRCILRFFDFGKQIGDPYPTTVQFHSVPKQAIIALSDGSILNLCTLTGLERYIMISPGRRAKINSEAWPIENLDLCPIMNPKKAK